MFLSLFRKIDESSSLMGLTVIYEIAVTVGIALITKPLELYKAGPIPDLRFGYTPTQLYDIFEAYGADGRALYIKGGIFDCFPYMWGYCFLAGALLTKVARKAGFGQTIAYLPVIAVLCDAVENVVQISACYNYPQRLGDTVIVVGSLAQQIKWSSFALAVLCIVVLGLKGFFPSPAKPNKQA